MDFVSYVASIHRAVHALGLYFEFATGNAVTQAEAAVLMQLATGGDRNTVNDVHRAFLHRRSTLTNILDRLESRGLVERRVGEQDRRKFHLHLTRRGETIARRLLEAMHDLEMTVAVQGTELAHLTATLETTSQAAASLSNAKLD